MRRELKYIIKGCFFAEIFFAAVLVFRASFWYNNQSKNINTTIVIDCDKLLNERGIVAGKTLFRSNCEACHSLNKTVDGPDLKEIEKRVPDKKLLFAWIRNSTEVLKSGDPYFTALDKKYNMVKMSSFPNLTDKDIDLILNYIKVVSACNGKNW